MEALAERPYITSAFEDGKSRVTPGAFKVRAHVVVGIERDKDIL